MSRPIAPMRMPYSGRDVPHVVIEVNQRCNISCLACYKDKSTYTKPLEAIKAEIELALSKRNLSVVTLAGGEPTLHPELPEIIEFIARKGVAPQMLSNGLTLDDERLRTYRERGLARVYLHVDSLQKRPDARRPSCEADLDRLREEIGARVVRSGVRCALSVTVYKNRNFKDLPDVTRFVLASPSFDRLLVTCCTDFNAIGDRLFALGRLTAPPAPLPDLVGEGVSNADVERALSALGMTPYGFHGSSLDHDARRWLFYYAFTLHFADGTHRALHFGPSFKRVVGPGSAISRLLRGKYPFELRIGRAGSIAMLLAYAATSLDPGAALATARFLSALRRKGTAIVQKSFIFQQGPNVTESGELEICRDCPDSTVRDGKLVPVCLADLLAPMEEEGAAPPPAVSAAAAPGSTSSPLAR